MHVFICLWNLDLSVASSTSCTSAMHDIGICVIGGGGEEEEETSQRKRLYGNKMSMFLYL